MPSAIRPRHQPTADRNRLRLLVGSPGQAASRAFRNGRVGVLTIRRLPTPA